MATQINEFQRGISAGVKYAMDMTQSFEMGAEPLTPNHIFGDYTLVMRPPIKLLEGSRQHRDRLIEAVSASAVTDLGSAP